MKKVIALLMMILFVFTGCLTDDDDDKKEETNDNGTNNYTPFKLNATWSYDSLWDTGDYQYAEEYTDTIKGTKSIDGKTYWMMVSDSFDEYSSYSDTSYFRVSNNIVYSFFDDIFFDVAKPAKMNNIANMIKTAKVASQEVPILKFGVANGTTWNIYNDSGSYDEYSYSIDMKGKYRGTESIEVTAGSFQNCAKIELTLLMSSTYEDETYSSTSVTTMWFAPNVGVVKNVEVYTDVYDSEAEIHTTTDTLKSYNIP